MILNYDNELLVSTSAPSKSLGSILTDSLVTGVLPSVTEAALLDHDYSGTDAFEPDSLDSWNVDPLSGTRSSATDLIQEGALHRSSIATARHASGVTSQSADVNESSSATGES